MSDASAAMAAVVITAAHIALFAVSWAWAARSRHVGFLLLLVPAALAWALAGLPMVRVLTYGTHAFALPASTPEVVGFSALVIGFAALFACAAGCLMAVAKGSKTSKSHRRATSPGVGTMPR